MNITSEPEIEQLPTRTDTQSKSGRLTTDFFEPRHGRMKRKGVSEERRALFKANA